MRLVAQQVVVPDGEDEVDGLAGRVLHHQINDLQIGKRVTVVIGGEERVGVDGPIHEHILPVCGHPVKQSEASLRVPAVGHQIKGIAVTHPVERCAVVVHQVAGAVGWVHPVPHLKPAAMFRGQAGELPLPGITFALPIAHAQAVAPLPRDRRRKAHAPGLLAVPEARYRPLPPIRSSEHGREVDLADVVGVIVGRLQRDSELQLPVAGHLQAVRLDSTDARDRLLFCGPMPAP